MFCSSLVPAIIPTSESALRDFLASIGPVSEIHVDVVDGVFVPFVSWPYTPPGVPQAVHSLCEPYTLEVDLMVENPLVAAQSWLEAGADMLVFHIETISVEALRQFSEETNITIGVSALNDTPYETLYPYAAVADYVQVMGIAEIGAQGQPFDDRAMVRITQLRTDFPQLALSLDGSVNNETLPDLVALRLSRYIVGSAVTKATNPREAYHRLANIVSSTG